MKKNSPRTDVNLKNTEWLNAPSTRAVFFALDQEGCEARVVGGAIRNTLLGKQVRDIDLATTAAPEKTMELARKAGLKVVPTGLQHGTVTVVSNGIPYEVTTLRHDVETDGRRAKVAFTDDWLADASRRDFTMNALYANADGQIYDPLNGYEDLLACRVRFIGEPVERIREDFLRILRYFRFKAEYGLEVIDPPSLHACIQEREGLRTLSSERIASELTRLITAPSAMPVLDLMFSSGLLVMLFGSVVNPGRLRKLLQLEKTTKLKTGAMLRMATLAAHTEEHGDQFFNRFRLSNENRKILQEILGLRPDLTANMTEKNARIALYQMQTSGFRNRLLYSWIKSGDAIDNAKWKALLKIADTWNIPVFPLKGRDLLDIGYRNGPDIGATLKHLEFIWMDSDFKLTRQRLLQCAKKRLTHP